MKEISFEHGGKEYTLCFTRKTVDTLADRGFDLDKGSGYMPKMLPMFFYGAFLAKHPMIKQRETDKILKVFTKKTQLWGMLGEMYSDAVNTLLGEPEDGDEGNVVWTANWQGAEEE